MKRLIFDGNSIVNRAFYGIRPLTTSDGLYTNAIYGFLNIILKFIEEEKPDEAAIAFDMRGKTFRHKLFDGYKAGRKGMPQELADQMPPLFELVDALKIARIGISGYEADDVIGTLCEDAEKKGISCVIITGDRDALQLVSPLVTVKLAVPKQGTTQTVVFDENAVIEKYGVGAPALLDVKALMGDQSDNIPGVAGVGEKTALSLVKNYGDIDTLYSRISTEDIRPALKEKLVSGRENAYLSKKLGEINKAVPLSLSEGDLILKSPDKPALRALLNRLEFASFIERLELSDTDTSEKTKETISEIRPQNLSGTADEIIEKGEIYFTQQDGEFNFLIDGQVNVITEADAGYDAFMGRIMPLSTVKKYTHDAKSFILILLKKGISFKGFSFDTRLAEYILSPSLPSKNLSDLVRRYLGEDIHEHAGNVKLLPSLVLEMAKHISENEQDFLLHEIEEPLCVVLASMEYWGFKVDKNALLSFKDELDEKLSNVTKGIYDFAGREFNINSPKQLAEVLFEDIGLPPVQKTKTGYSTSAQVLERLLGFHDIIDLILEHRQVSKLNSTYVQGLCKVIEPDGRIHTSFHQTVTQTGRISSTEPNLQNIPVRYELGRRIRHMFVPENHDFLLVDADYSQIELRVLAHLAKDENMINAFLKGEDIHTKTASEVFGVSINNVTDEMRSRAKAVNFGIVYGISDFSLAKDIKVPQKEAKRYIEDYLSLYSGVRNYMDEIVRFALQNGYVATLFGRRRYIPELFSQNKNTKAFGQRIALNSPIQGTAADIIKIAMVRVHMRLLEKSLRSRLILQVHDELIVETHKDELDEVFAIIKTEMEKAASLSVPLVADVNSGRSWYDVK